MSTNKSQSGKVQLGGHDESEPPSQDLSNTADNVDQATNIPPDVSEIQVGATSTTTRVPARAVQSGFISASIQSDGENSRIAHASLELPTKSTTTDSEGKRRVSLLTVSQASQPGAVAVAGCHDNDDSDLAQAGQHHSVPTIPSRPTIENSLPVVPYSPPGQSSYSTRAPLETQVESATMIEAELVQAPIEALQVAIDEEHSAIHPFELEHAPQSGATKISTHTFWLCLALLGVMALCAITIPLTLSGAIQRTQPGAVPPTEPDAPFPYFCYNSTWKILEAQISDEPTPEAYIICPGTNVKVGTFRNPAVDDYTVVDGDYPIMVIRENVTIQCGLDGKRENNCVLDSGFMQVLTLQRIPLPENAQLIYNGRIDNLRIQGITFTGIPEDSGPFSGQSVTLSQPGKNIRFEDCLWVDMSVPALISVLRNTFQVTFDLPLEPRSIDVVFEDCTFKRIVYSFPLFVVVSQTVAFRRCIFEDIRPSILAPEACDLGEANVIAPGLFFAEGCASLLYANAGAVVSMENSCVELFGTYGPGLVIVHEETNFEHDGLFLRSSNTDCEAAFIVDDDTTDPVCVDIFDEYTCMALSD